MKVFNTYLVNMESPAVKSFVNWAKVGCFGTKLGGYDKTSLEGLKEVIAAQ
jgi:hypothetical protein